MIGSVERTFLPRQYECMCCVRYNQNCDDINFEEMNPVGEYPGISILVKCTSFVKRENNV